MEFLYVGLLIPIVSIIATAVVIIFALERFYKVRRLDHNAKLAAIEKGYDVPLQRPKPRYPFAWPFVLIGFGLALILIFAFMGGHDEESLGFGLVLFFIGLGLLASRFVGVRKEREEEALARAAWRSPAQPIDEPPAEHTSGV